MSNPVQNAYDPKLYGYGSDSEPTTQNPGYDPGFDDGAIDPGMDLGGSGDPFDDGFADDNFGLGQQGDFGFESSGPALSSVDDGRQHVQYLIDQVNQSTTLSASEKNDILTQLDGLQGQLNHAQSLGANQKSAELARIFGELGSLEGQIYGQADEFGEFGEGSGISAKDLEKDLKDYKREVRKMQNLSDTEQDEALAKIEQWIEQIELEGSEVDLSTIQEDLTMLKEELEELNGFTPGQRSLAEKTGLSPEEIQKKAEEAGIDLENLSVPPSKEVLEFLMELDPNLKSAFESVQDAMDERTVEIQTNQESAYQVSRGNWGGGGSSDGNDQKDPLSWQNLFDLKYHQDPVSDAVKEAMESAVDALMPFLEALYPGEEITKPEVEGVSGWERKHEQYLNADKIQIGGVTIDLFDNGTGDLQSSTQADADPEIDIPRLWWDGEGDGKWDGPGVMSSVSMYADEGKEGEYLNNYDSDDSDGRQDYRDFDLYEGYVTYDPS